MRTRVGTFVRTALDALRWPKLPGSDAGHDLVPPGDLDKLHPELSRSIRAALEAGMTQAELAAKLREVAS